MIKSQTSRKTILSLVLPLALGFVSFFVIIGPNALNPTNISWLDSGDPPTYYLGWLFFRNSDWEFPIGLNSSYGLEIANSILYSDSNPLLAFLFKPFSSFLPETFQYFGIWLLICFVLQAWFGSKLVSLVTDSIFLRLLGAGFFVFSPPMIDRMGGHLNLAGHFFILAALYLAFSPNPKSRKVLWGGLMSATALVHPYLLVLVSAIWIADLGGRTIKRRAPLRKSIVEFSTLVALVGFVCWQVGYFTVGNGTSSSGFGRYRMNLLSMIDPNGWSYLLKDLPQTAGEYEGFSYLGLGNVCLIVFSLLYLVGGKFKIGHLARRFWHLLLLLVAFTFYAVSNKISLGGLEFQYALPGVFLDFANIFRASGRMFWPVFYMIIFTSIFFVVKALERRLAIFVLGLALIVQVADTSVGWLTLRKKLMRQPKAEWSLPLTNAFWADAAKKYKNVRSFPIQNHAPKWQAIAYYAGKNQLATNAVYLARIGSQSLQNARRQSFEVLRQNDYDKDSLYILDDATFRKALIGRSGDTDLFAKIDTYNVIAPDWKNCSDCRVITDEVDFDDLPQLFKVGERIVFNNSGIGISHLGPGWSTPEAWGTWSEGVASVVYLPIPSRRVRSVYIEANLLISSSLKSHRVDLLINGVSAETIRFDKQKVAFEVVIPEAAKVALSSGLKMEFHFPDAARPKDIGLGDDGRTLAFGLVALTLR